MCASQNHPNLVKMCIAERDGPQKCRLQINCGKYRCSFLKCNNALNIKQNRAWELLICTLDGKVFYFFILNDEILVQLDELDRLN